MYLYNNKNNRITKNKYMSEQEKSQTQTQGQAQQTNPHAPRPGVEWAITEVALDNVLKFLGEMKWTVINELMLYIKQNVRELPHLNTQPLGSFMNEQGSQKASETATGVNKDEVKEVDPQMIKEGV